MTSRNFALILGIVLLLAGIAGFIPGLVTQAPPDAGVAPGDPGAAPDAVTALSYGYLLGLFPVNVLHNLFHVVWGIYGIAVYRSISGARTFARVTAVVYAILTVLGLIPGLYTMFGLLPLFGHDVWLHAIIAIAAAYFGWAKAPPATEPATSARPRPVETPPSSPRR